MPTLPTGLHAQQERQECLSLTARTRLGVDSPQADGEGNPLDGQHIGSDAWPDLVPFRMSHDVIEAAAHEMVHALSHLRQGPEIALAVLHPLKVGNRHPAGVRQNIGDYKDPLLLQYLVGSKG